MTRPMRLSASPIFANRMKSGMTAVMIGSDWMMNSSREYPATALLRPRERT